MTRLARVVVLSSLFVFLVALVPQASAQEGVAYKKPPKEILQLVDVAPAPAVMVDGDGRWVAVMARPGFKSLEELAEPELRLAICPVSAGSMWCQHQKGH